LILFSQALANANDPRGPLDAWSAYRSGRNTMLMQAHADALPLALERGGEPRWRQAAARSAQERCDVREFEKCEIGRDIYPLYNSRASVGAACAWAAFYAIIVIHQLIASGN
jgi:hypothetical protein